MGTIQRMINGERIDFEVTDAGHFTTTLEDIGEVSDSTLGGAVEQVEKLLKKKRAGERKPIDVTVLGIRPRDAQKDYYDSSAFAAGDRAIDFTLRGYTERTRMLLVTTTDGKKGQLDKHNFGERVVRRLTAVEHAEYSQLQEQLARAKAALEDFTGARLVDWRTQFEVGVKRG